MRIWVWTCLLTVGCSGCFLTHRVTEKISRKVTGPVGWFHLDNNFALAPDGGAVIPEPGKDEPIDADAVDYDENERMEVRMKAHFERAMIQMVLDQETPCPAITGELNGTRKGPVFLLVHGVKGANEEWYPVMPVLEAMHPAGMFMFRWNATQVRQTILDTLGPGMDRIVACYPKHQVFVLAHSAGGVLMSFEASRLVVGEPITVYTVASPLAGVGYHAAGDEEDDNTRFLNDLGAIKKQYLPAAPNVTVVHLRTSYPADTVMKPNAYGRAPNQKGVGVEGAREVDLPDNLGHDDSLLWVVKQLAAGKRF